MHMPSLFIRPMDRLVDSILWESVEIAGGQAGIGVNAAVAEKRPPAPYVFGTLKVHIDHSTDFAVGGRPEKELTLRSGDKRVAPERYTGSGS